MNKKTILIVEDDPLCGELAATIAKLNNLEPQCCWSAEEAINVYRERLKNNHCPTLILIDIHLPKIDGCDLIEILRGNAKIPMVAFPGWITCMSTDASATTMDACLRAGANDFLPKPFKLDALNARLKVGLAMSRLLQTRGIKSPVWTTGL